MHQIFSYKELSPSYKETLKKWISNKDLSETAFYFLIIEKNSLLGFATLEPSPKPTLTYIFVSENYRYRMEGTYLLRYIKNFCTVKNWDNLYLKETYIKNHPSLKEFFIRSGFSQIENQWIKRDILSFKDRYKKTFFCLVVSSLSNFFLGILKTIAGYISGSQAIIADGMHTLIDGLHSTFLFFTSFISNKESDHNHPFGHANIEHISAIIMATTLLMAGFNIAYSSLKNLSHPSALSHPYLIFLTLSISLILKYFLFSYKLSVSQNIKDPSLKAAALESKSDIYSTLGVMLGITLNYLGLLIADALTGLIVSLFIIKESYLILKESANKLMNHQDENLIQEIQKIVEKWEEVKNTHDIRLKYDGNQIYVFLNIRLSNDISLKKSHKLTHDIERSIQTAISDVKEVFIHIEPTMQ